MFFEEDARLRLGDVESPFPRVRSPSAEGL
jgi:hypothetical protein